MGSPNVKIQLYVVSATAPPVYDHPLTLKDEVVEFRNDGDAERNPTARHRSVSHERQGVLSAQSVKLFCEVPQLTIS